MEKLKNLNVESKETQDIKKRANNFVPYDKMMDGFDTEDLYEEDANTKIIKVLDK